MFSVVCFTSKFLLRRSSPLEYLKFKKPNLLSTLLDFDFGNVKNTYSSELYLIGSISNSWIHVYITKLQYLMGNT